MEENLENLENLAEEWDELLSTPLPDVHAHVDAWKLVQNEYKKIKNILEKEKENIKELEKKISRAQYWESRQKMLAARKEHLEKQISKKKCLYKCGDLVSIKQDLSPGKRIWGGAAKVITVEGESVRVKYLMGGEKIIPLRLVSSLHFEKKRIMRSKSMDNIQPPDVENEYNLVCRELEKIKQDNVEDLIVLRDRLIEEHSLKKVVFEQEKKSNIQFLEDGLAYLKSI